MITYAQTPTTISFLPPPSTVSAFPTTTANPLISNLTFPPNTTHFDLFKNSRFSTVCPFQTAAPLAESGEKVQIANGWVVFRSQVKTQEEFCMHLRPDIEWIILPTNTTSAAYLPNWTSTVLDLAWLIIQCIVLLAKPFSNQFGPSDFFLFLWGCAQQIYWSYQMGVGFSSSLHAPNGLHAPWLNPLAWITGITWIIEFVANDAPKVLKGFLVLGWSWGITALTESFVYIGTRYPPNLRGMGSYTPFLAGSFQPFGLLPTLPLSSRSGCYGLLRDPRYPLFSDPLSRVLRTMQMLFISLSTPLLFLSLGYCGSDHDAELVQKWKAIVFLWSIVLQIGAVIGTSVLASRGTPFMRDEHCGVVVIAMSPRLGYWDAQLYEEAHNHQIIRAVFGLCKRLAYKHSGFIAYE